MTILPVWVLGRPNERATEMHIYLISFETNAFECKICFTVHTYVLNEIDQNSRLFVVHPYSKWNISGQFTFRGVNLSPSVKNDLISKKVYVIRTLTGGRTIFVQRPRAILCNAALGRSETKKKMFKKGAMQRAPWVFNCKKYIKLNVSFISNKRILLWFCCAPGLPWRLCPFMIVYLHKSV